MVQESVEADTIDDNQQARVTRSHSTAASFPRKEEIVNNPEKLTPMAGTTSKADFLKKLLYFESGVQNDSSMVPPKFGVRVIQPGSNGFSKEFRARLEKDPKISNRTVTIIEERLKPVDKKTAPTTPTPTSTPNKIVNGVAEPQPRLSASARYEINDDFLTPTIEPFLDKEMHSKIEYFEYGMYHLDRMDPSEEKRFRNSLGSVQLISLDSSQFTFSHAVIVQSKFLVMLKGRMCPNTFYSLKYLMQNRGKKDLSDDIYNLDLDIYKLDLFDNDFYESELSDDEEFRY